MKMIENVFRFRFNQEI